jgi:hypothetical protein
VYISSATSGTWVCMFCKLASLHHGERQRYMDYGCHVGSHLMSSGGVFKRSIKREWHKVGPCIFTLAFGFAGWAVTICV